MFQHTIIDISLHIVGKLLSDSVSVLCLLLQISDSCFVFFRRTSNFSCDSFVDASLLSLNNSLLRWFVFHTTTENKC